jgi:hypothetical protein
MWWKRRGGAGVRRFLMTEWDPIGVAGIPEAADEYDAYVGVIGGMLRDRAGSVAIAYLADVRSHRMGLGPSPEGEKAAQDVAGRLVEWYGQEMRSAESD